MIKGSLNTAQVFPCWIIHGDQQGLVAPSSVIVTSSHRYVYKDKWVKKMCYFIQWNIWLCLVAQSYPTLCDPMDCSTPGFSVPLAKKVTSDVQLQAGVLKLVYGKAYRLFSIMLSNEQISLDYKRDQLRLNSLIKNIKVFGVCVCVCVCVCVFSCSVMSDSLWPHGL